MDRPTPHPYWKLPSPEQMATLASTPEGADQLAQFLRDRETRIKAEIDNPYDYGVDLEVWSDADDLLAKGDEVLVLGGNRSSKTEWAAKRLVQNALSAGDRMGWALHTSGASSIEMQQPVVYKYLPVEMQTPRRSKTTAVSYSIKNGFTQAKLVLPNRSQLIFKNYMQEPRVIEGGETDFIWTDELVPISWIKTLRYRNATRKGKLVVTFTPVLGYTPTVAEYISGCRMLKTKKAELLPHKVNMPGVPKGHMPYIAETRFPGKYIIWFWSEFNPYGGYERLSKELIGRPSNEVKIRAYGWTDKTSGHQFPQFSENNIISDEDIPPAKQCTNYMAVDPAGARNWFMLWLRVDKDGRCYVYREWPDHTIGEWAVPGDKADGKMGVAQTYDAGKGFDAVKETIRRLEGGEEFFDRYIDPRAGATQAIGKDGGTSVMDHLATGDNPMLFIPSAGISVDQGVARINDLLSWDQTAPLSGINQPNLYVSESCKNLIYSLKEWTGADGEKGASKDPIDALRYILVMDPIYISKQSNKAIRAKGGY